MKKKNHFFSEVPKMRILKICVAFLFLTLGELVASNVYANTAMHDATDQTTIKGTVTDSQGVPLAGVTVLLKGTTTGTSTDFDGNYTLNLPVDNGVLVFSYLGFETQEIQTNNRNEIDVVMLESMAQLDEVVVVGFGTQKKVNLTGSVGTVDTDLIKNRAVTNVTQLVQGVVPGVTIVDSPNSGTSLTIRGQGNLGSSSPLYVIDGVIADSGLFQRLQPSNIENISFLKDASSSAIYGSRAAFGVVLVTTKKGSEGKLNVSYDYTSGFKSTLYRPEFVGSKDYIKLYNEAATNSGLAELNYTADLDKFDGSDPDHFPNTDWFGLFYKDNANLQNHSLTMSGGGKVSYNVNLGYTDEDMLLRGKNRKRYNLTSNMSSDLTEYLTLKSNIKYLIEDYDSSTGGFNQVNVSRFPATAVAKHSDGTYGTIEGGTNWGFASANPLRDFEIGGRDEYETKRTVVDLGLDIKPLKGLVITPSITYLNTDYKQSSFSNTYPDLINFDTKMVMPGTGRPENSMSVNWSESARLLLQNLARYSTQIDAHSIDALLGFTYESNVNKSLFGSRRDFYSNNMNNLGSGSSDPVKIDNGGGISEYALASYFGRVNYSFMERYLLEANLRVDQSSRFHPDARTGYFPSFSAGWRLSEEPMLKDALSMFSNLKVRGSWGILGNINNVGNYDYFEQIQITNGYNFEGTPAQGAREGKIANPALTWEEVVISGVGLDGSLKNGLLSFTFDWYNKQTKNILLSLPVPREQGLRGDQVPTQNAGEVNNKGIELTLNHKYSFDSGLHYSVGINFSKNNNEIIDLKKKDPIINGNQIYKVGQAIGTYYGYKTNGLYSQEDIDNGNFVKLGSVTPKAGQVKYVDQLTVDTDGDGIMDAGDGVINAADRTYIGKSLPNITFGGNFNIGYKNFNLSAIVQGVKDVSVYLNNEASRAFFNGGNAKEFHLKRWTPENPDVNAPYPVLSLNNDYDFQTSDFWLFDADYLRIKNITFSYNLEDSIVKRMGLSNFTMYISADNFFTIHGDKRMADFDPELTSTRSIVPGTKVASFGINIGI